MGRPAKKGLDYFPLDVDIFDDEKIQLISSEFGIKGELIYIRLLCKVYKTGYYYQWGEDEALLFAKGVGNGVTGAIVNEVLQGCLRRSLFDKRVFEVFKILTSKGIQERYQYICRQLKRPFEIDSRFDCRSMAELKRELTPGKMPFPPEEKNKSPEEIQQMKGNERKEKESELRARTVESDVWLEQTAVHTGKSKAHVLAFCNRFITEKVLSGDVETYGPQALIRFMLVDLQKNSGNNNQKKRTNLN